MVEPVNLDDRELDHDAVAAELDRLSSENEGRIRFIATNFGQVVNGLETLYLKVAIEHLIGAWELPKMRLRYQREVANLLEMMADELSRRRLSGEEMQEQTGMSASALVEHLPAPNRAGRRLFGKG